MNKLYKNLITKVIQINKNELAKFSCTAILMVLIAYVHSILHISKDVLIISHLGTESISAIKVWAVLPISLALMCTYIKLSDKFTRATLFHLMNCFFICYFIIFALFLYPHREALSINIDKAFIASMPSLKYFFKIVKDWHYSLFYVFSEDWVMIMMAISFWQTANHITTIDESKRFYPLFGIAAGLGKMIASILTTKLIIPGTNWQPTLNNITISIVIAGIAIYLCLITLEKIVGKKYFNAKKPSLTTNNKNKISIKESLKYIASSKIILMLSSLLLCYNLSLNLVEGVWKKSMEVFFNSQANKVHMFISSVDIYTSALSIIGAFIGIYILRSLKWKTAAIISPIIVLITGAMFFLFVIFSNNMNLFILGSSATAIAVYFGVTYEIFSRSSKFALFDPSKEMVYIPLDDDLKTKGKAAVETIGMRFGKGGGAFIQQILFALLPTYTLLDLSPIIFVIFSLVLIWWLYSVVVLGKLLHPKQQITQDFSGFAEALENIEKNPKEDSAVP